VETNVTVDDAFESYSLSDAVLELLGESVDPVGAGLKLRDLAESVQGRGVELVQVLATQADMLPRSDPAIVGALLRVIHTTLLPSGQDALRQLDVGPLRRIERALPAGASNRYLLQHLYAMIRTEDSLKLLVNSLRDHPPDDWIGAAQVLSPLMQHEDWPLESLFPEVLDCLQYPALASPLLDVASFLVRQSRTVRHPATDRLPMLNELLGAVCGRLSRFEQDPHSLGDDVQTVQAKLGEAVALAV
jgi:hypothetical protein